MNPAVCARPGGTIPWWPPAIAQVQPAGVDVISGVENASGRKDGARMRAFVARALAALG
jgi:hypothetical protein